MPIYTNQFLFQKFHTIYNNPVVAGFVSTQRNTNIRVLPSISKA